MNKSENTPAVVTADLDKIAEKVYKILKKEDLTVEDARSVTYRVNRKIAQNSKI